MTALTQSHPLVHIGLLLLCGYAGGRIANYLNLPRVTGYLVMGMILSPSVLGVFNEELVREDLSLITDIALAIIAFSVGGTLELSKVRKLGRQILWITLFQASAAFLFVTGIITLVFPLIGGGELSRGSAWFPMALVIGAISAATAPAVILAIIHEYRAGGPLTTTLLGVVSLDDTLTILFYTFAVSLAGSLVTGTALSWQGVVAVPLAHIGTALAIGGILGVCFRFLTPYIHRREAMLGVTAGAIFLASGLAIGFHSSALLASMTLGFVVTNFVRHSEDLFGSVDTIEEALFAMFFTLAGAHLDLGVIGSAGWLAVLIVAGRFAGKFLGARLGAVVSGAPEVVRRYLGFGLLPKAGITVGLVLAAKEIFPSQQVSELMVNAVLATVIINELFSPMLVRHALAGAGEIQTGDEG
jgi:Kef-type K+ transport system membrane component KefB